MFLSAHHRPGSGIGMERNGSRSWIGVGAFSIQPSEFMKLAMIAFWPSFYLKSKRILRRLEKALCRRWALSFQLF